MKRSFAELIGIGIILLILGGFVILGNHINFKTQTSMAWGFIGILMEIFGFVLMLTSERKLILKRGDYIADHYVDPNTGETPQEIIGVPIPTQYNIGIGIIICGLILQVIGLGLIPDFCTFNPTDLECVNLQTK